MVIFVLKIIIIELWMAVFKDAAFAPFVDNYLKANYLNFSYFVRVGQSSNILVNRGQNSEIFSFT